MVEALNHTLEFTTSDSAASDEVVLSVNNVSKRFCRDLKRSLVYGIQDITTDLLGLRQERTALRPKEFWALKDVSFQLRRGEALGLVGKNGSGKSTLLRVIAGLIKPDAGSVEVKGRVAPLIALGAGFNPVLTGRENVYNNMSILGLSREEIDERFDQVVEFAEIGDAIDSPVQSYSSGMGARLGFSCAIHTEPEILLLDEVLAVGDIRFRAKCHRKLHELRQKKTSFILVSHHPQAILNICDKSIYLTKGELVNFGSTYEVMYRYEKELFSQEFQDALSVLYLPQKTPQESSGIDISYVCFKDSSGEILDSPMTGQPADFCIGCKVHNRFENVGLSFIVQELGGENGNVLSLSSFNDRKVFAVEPGECEIKVQMPYIGLKPGLYSMKIFLRQDAIYTFDCLETFKFSVQSQDIMSQSIFYQPRGWKLEVPSISTS